MNILFFLKPALQPALNLLEWLAGKTKWKWDDKVVKLARKLEGILLRYPDLCTSALNLAKYTKRTVDSEQKKFKGSKEKQKALKIIVTVARQLPKKDVENIVTAVKTELKKSSNNFFRDETR